MAQHTLVRHPLALRRLEVVRVHDVTPRMRRVTVSGPELEAFTRDGFDLPAFVTETFDDHVKLVFAADGDIESALPVQRARSIDWPPSEHRRGRDYTPRRFEPEAGELDLDFVLHGDGPAASWASDVRPGDVLHVVGPKSSLVLPENIDWVLLAGDETALPAIGRYLDERPRGVPVQVVVEVRDLSAKQDLRLRDGDTLRWVVTGAGQPSALPAAVRGVTWWPGAPYVWVAGESRSLVPLRRWLRRDQALPPSHVNVTGYWHAEEPEIEATGTARVDPETVLSPLPWLATRAAIDLGVLEVMGEHPVPVSDVASRLGVDAAALGTVTTYLGSIDVLRTDGDTIALGPLAEELVDDDHLRDELFGSSVEARSLDALGQLAPALRGSGQETGSGEDGSGEDGRSGRDARATAWSRATGRTLAEDIESDRDLYADRMEGAGSFAFVAGGVPDLAVWRDARRIVVTGPGAVTLTTEARGRHAADGVTILAPKAVLDVVAAEAGDLPVTVTDALAEPAELIVSTMEVGYRGDDDLIVHLAGLSEHADRALVIEALERTGPGSGTAHAAEHDLLTLAGTGRGPRTANDVQRAAVAAGWEVTMHTHLGWDYEAFELRRRS